MTDLSSSQKKKDPRIWGSLQVGIKARLNDYLGSSGVHIHKYGLDTSSSQLGFKAKVCELPGNSMFGTSITAWYNLVLGLRFMIT